VESLQEDLAQVVDVINARKASELPPLKVELGWEQQGPLTKQSMAEDADAEQGPTAHVQSYADCGDACLQAVQQYYKQDFALFQYPVE
jgi:hypothetical protein